MQILRDWMGVGRATDHRTSVWPDDPADAADAARRRLRVDLAETVRPRDRLDRIETLFARSRAVLGAVERQIGAATVPLTGGDLRAARAGDDLLKALAAAYGTLLKARRRQADGPARLAVCRLAECLAWRIRLAQRAYARPSEKAWRHLHRTHAFARAQGSADHPLDHRTVAERYTTAVILAHADPARLSRRDFDRLAEAIERLAVLARVVPATDAALPPGMLAAAPPASARRPTGAANADAAFWIDCREVLATADATVPEARDLLDQVLRPPAPRRHPRVRTRSAGELMVGLPAVIDALGGGRLAAPAVGSEWTVVDESADGFGLRHRRGAPGPLAVGELAGLRLKEAAGRLHIGIVRRIGDAGGRLTIGLQELSPRARAVALPGSPGSHGIFLPALSDGTCGVLAEAGALAAGGRLHVDGRALVVAQLRETTGAYAIWLLNAP